MEKFDLSDSFINTIALPGVKENSISFRCQFEKGLILIVRWRKGVFKTSSFYSSKNRESLFHFIWRLRYVKANGVRSTIDLGFWPSMNQDAAVKAATAVKGAVAVGRDPVSEKRVEQELIIPKSITSEITSIAYLLSSFIEWRKEQFPEKESTTWFYKKQIDNHILPRWGMFSVSDITQWVWQEYIREVRRRFSDTVAKNVHSTMRAALSFAVQSDHFAHVNVNQLLGLKVLKELKTVSRNRFFSNEELHCWMNELAQRPVPETHKNILHLQLLQGLRISEIINIKVSELNTLNKSEIKVVVKGGRDGYSMLSTQAIELIKSQMRYLISMDRKSIWLFPLEHDNEKNYSSRQVGDFVKAVRRNWLSFSTHDLRRTCRTWLGEFGCSKEMRDKICNHALPTGKDASYDHAKRKDEQLRWMQLWADKLDEIKSNANAFMMESDTSIDAASASELDDLMSQLL